MYYLPRVAEWEPDNFQESRTYSLGSICAALTAQHLITAIEAVVCPTSGMLHVYAVFKMFFKARSPLIAAMWCLLQFKHLFVPQLEVQVALHGPFNES